MANKERHNLVPVEEVAERLHSIFEIFGPMLVARKLAKDTKLNNKPQAPAWIEATIRHALIIGLLTIIGYTMACSL